MSDTLETSLGPLTVIPVEHASLILTFAGKVLYSDPCGGAERYAGLPRPTGILVTHQHSDHLDIATLEALAGPNVPLLVSRPVFEELPAPVRAHAKAIGNGEAGTIDGVQVRAIPAYNHSPDRLRYHPRGVGNGYLLSVGDKTIYISGDTEDTPEMRALTGVDLAFLPMNLPYTMTAEQAAAAARAFRPGIVYPFHYTGNDFPQRFAGLMEGSGTEVRLRDWYPRGA